MLLLNLVASQVTCLVIRDEHHLLDQLVDFVGTGVLGLLAQVELLGSLGSIRVAQSVARCGSVVILGLHCLAEFASSASIELNVNTGILQLLHDGLPHSLRGGVITEDGVLEGSLLAVLLVELAVLGVASLFQNLGSSSCIVVRGRVNVLVVLGEGHVDHRTRLLLFVIQALETHLGNSFALQACHNRAAQSNVLHAGGVHDHTAGEEANTATHLGVSNFLQFLVACGSRSGGSVNLIVLERRTLSSGIHLTEDDALQNGLLAPPLVVAGQGQGLLGGVPATLGNGERTSSVLGVRVIHEALVEDVLVQQSRVQNLTEEDVHRVVRLSEGDLHLEVITVALHGANARVNAAGLDLVVAVGALEDVPGSLQSLVVDGGTVVELSHGVQFDGDHGYAVLLGNVEALGKLGRQGALAHGVCLPDAVVVYGAQSSLGVGGNAGAQEVEVRAERSHGQTQSAAILQLRNSGLSDVVQFLGIGTCGCALGGGLGVLRRAARSQYAHSAQRYSATENGTTIQDEILLHESVLLYV